MTTLYIILLIIFGLIILIGLIRLMFSFPNNFLEFIMELFLIDWLVDVLVWIIKSIGESDFD